MCVQTHAYIHSWLSQDERVCSSSLAQEGIALSTLPTLSVCCKLSLFFSCSLLQRKLRLGYKPKKQREKSSILYPWAKVTDRAGKESPHHTREFLPPLHCREGNPTRSSNGAAGITSHSVGLSPSLRDITRINDSLLLCPLKFGRPCLSEILQALALSLCLYLAQTY